MSIKIQTSKMFLIVLHKHRKQINKAIYGMFEGLRISVVQGYHLLQLKSSIKMFYCIVKM